MRNQAYVSGRYTADTEAEIMVNIRRAIDAGDTMLKLGYAPIIPHVCMNHNTSWDKAIEHDLGILRSLCPLTDVIVMLPGWEKSLGAQREREEAVKRGIRVVLYDDILMGKL